MLYSVHLHVSATIAICKKFNNKKEAKALFILTITPVTRLIDADAVMDNHPNVN